MPKVLLIEDRRENILFIADNILKPKGYEVITAMDGETGLKKAQEEAPDLIITDVKMPGLGGLDVLEELNAEGYYIPAIVMTFHGTETTAMRALKAGAIDYLTKPFTVEEMEGALDKAFRTSKDLASRAKVSELEKKLAKSEATLEERDRQLKQTEKQLAKAISTSKLNASANKLKEENVQLSRALNKSEAQMTQLERENIVLKKTIITQKKHLERYAQEFNRISHQLHNLPNIMQAMAQDMNQQIERIGVLVPPESVSNGDNNH